MTEVHLKIYDEGFSDGKASASTEIGRLRAALNAAAARFDDIAGIIEREGSYTNAGFFRASARRCREIDFYPSTDA